jgi:predicted esterase
VAWEGSSDDTLMRNLFAAIDDDNGPFGPLNSERLYATGISSGGFMTSRMAVSYPGRFRALAIHSGGYAWCSAVCVLPSSLPASHPPTLFVHGLNDLVVTPGVMTMYREALEADGVEVDVVIDDNAAHEWTGLAVDAIPAWFAVP